MVANEITPNQRIIANVRPGATRTHEGSFEEVSDWLNRDLTLSEASRAHVKLWFGDDATPYPHDMSHVIYGLVINRPPVLDQYYQGDGRAEAFTTSIQRALASPGSFTTEPEYFATQEGFKTIVKERAELFLGGENLIRTLSWLMGKETGRSTDEQRVANGFELNNIIEAAQKSGVQVIKEDWPSEDWKVETNNGKVYAYSTNNPEQNIFPAGNNGVEEFEPYTIPTDEEILEVFCRIKPVLDDLQPQIRAVTELFGPVSTDHEASVLENLRVRDIVARMEGVLDNKLEISLFADSMQPLQTAEALNADELQSALTAGTFLESTSGSSWYEKNLTPFFKSSGDIDTSTQPMMAEVKPLEALKPVSEGAFNSGRGGKTFALERN